MKTKRVQRRKILWWRLAAIALVLIFVYLGLNLAEINTRSLYGLDPHPSAVLLQLQAEGFSLTWAGRKYRLKLPWLHEIVLRLHELVSSLFERKISG